MGYKPVSAYNYSRTIPLTLNNFNTLSRTNLNVNSSNITKICFICNLLSMSSDRRTETAILPQREKWRSAEAGPSVALGCLP